MDILHEEIGLVFNEVLQDAVVYKCTPEGLKSFERFIAAVKLRSLADISFLNVTEESVYSLSTEKFAKQLWH